MAGGYPANLRSGDLRRNTHGHYAGVYDEHAGSGTDAAGAAHIDDYRLSGAAISDQDSGGFGSQDGRKHSHTIASVPVYADINFNVRREPGEEAAHAD